MMRRAGLLALLSLACLSLAASEAERRSLEAWQAALTASDRRQRIEHLTESLAERYSHAAEFLLGRTVWEHPADARLAADLLLTRLEETNAVPELKLAEWMAVGLRQRFPAWQIGFDRWRQLEAAALAPVRQAASPLPPDDRRMAAQVARQLAYDERSLQHFDDALRIYDESEQLDPEPEAKGSAYFRALTAFAAAVWEPGDAALEKRLRAALADLAALEPADDDAPEDWFDFGGKYLQLRDEAGARRVMRKLEELHPQWPGTIFFRMRLLEWQGDYAALTEQAAALEREKDERPAAHLLRYRAAMCDGRWDEAVKMAETLRAPNEPSTMLVEALLYAGRWQEADAEIARFPSPMRDLLMLRRARHRKDFKSLLVTLRDADAKTRKELQKDLRLVIVGVAEYTGDRDLLKEYWAKLEKAGDLAEPEAANGIGYTAATMSHNLPEARKLIESALAAEPFSAAIQDSMAWVLFKQGDLAGARRWIDRSLAFSDREEDTELECHAAEICAAQGDREAAAAHCRRALALRPRLPELDEAALRAKLAELEKSLP